MRTLNIMGTRGVPALHGGFETFAERLSLYLVSRGWDVLVYCQEADGVETDSPMREDIWEGVRRIHFSTRKTGPLGTVEFDRKCVSDVLGRPGIDLVLGYNTAVFNIAQRFARRPVVMNMDGIEWKRQKWSIAAKAWFFLNEIIGSNFASIAVADHPEMAKHIKRRSFAQPVMIPYGADEVLSADVSLLERFQIEAGKYFISIARIEPENSILEAVLAFSSIGRAEKFIVLGRMDNNNPYHRSVRAAANGNVIFAGPVYDTELVKALRFYALAYVHGHQVGGTNPSLVESLGAGNPVIAHSNRFNRWTAGSGQKYFENVKECGECMSSYANDPDVRARAAHDARKRHRTQFQWEAVLRQYEEILSSLQCNDVRSMA